MGLIAQGAGLMPRFASPPPETDDPEDAPTEEAAIRGPDGRFPRITPLKAVGDRVAEGEPVAALRDAPQVSFVSPIPGRVAEIDLRPGHRLTEIILYRDAAGDSLGNRAPQWDSEADLREAMQRVGFWPRIRRRPFGGMPGGGERPAAIVVMAADTRPHAPDPRRVIGGQSEALNRGLRALSRLTDGAVILAARRGPALLEAGSGSHRIRQVDVAARHPGGLAGFQIHAHCPAAVARPVWDLDAEDVAALGTFLQTGGLPMTRTVSVAGAALRAGRLVRTTLGADLRALTRKVTLPGPHRILSGSPLDGAEARWLAPRHRQVSVLPRASAPTGAHWLRAALLSQSRPAPVIPTAALQEAFGHALPAARFVRALGAGDDEAAMSMGLLSFLEEDMALADYVLGGVAGLGRTLRAVLDRVAAELAA